MSFAYVAIWFSNWILIVHRICTLPELWKKKCLIIYPILNHWWISIFKTTIIRFIEINNTIQIISIYLRISSSCHGTVRTSKRPYEMLRNMKINIGIENEFIFLRINKQYVANFKWLCLNKYYCKHLMYLNVFTSYYYFLSFIYLIRSC